MVCTQYKKYTTSCNLGLSNTAAAAAAPAGAVCRASKAAAGLPMLNVVYPDWQLTVLVGLNSTHRAGHSYQCQQRGHNTPFYKTRGTYKPLLLDTLYVCEQVPLILMQLSSSRHS